MNATEQEAATRALERLDAELDTRDFATTLITDPGQPPRLSVTSRHAQLGDDILADQSFYWWPWAEQIAALDDPQAAAAKVAAVLRAVPAPSHG